MFDAADMNFEETRKEEKEENSMNVDILTLSLYDSQWRELVNLL